MVRQTNTRNSKVHIDVHSNSQLNQPGFFEGCATVPANIALSGT